MNEPRLVALKIGFLCGLALVPAHRGMAKAQADQAPAPKSVGVIELKVEPLECPAVRAKSAGSKCRLKIEFFPTLYEAKASEVVLRADKKILARKKRSSPQKINEPVSVPLEFASRGVDLSNLVLDVKISNGTSWESRSQQIPSPPAPNPAENK